MNKKVDVIINVYGKPYQTLVTLKSLMAHSSSHVDKIYLIEEANQPHPIDIKMIMNEFDNIIHYKPHYFNFVKKHKPNKFSEQKYRLSLRYQFGIEKSDKKFVFITHNDVVYNGDIIGLLLQNIDKHVGVGELGQCWNCPMHKASLCSPSQFNDFDYALEEIENAYLKFPPDRNLPIDKVQPFPLPECRLNEWFCLINNEINTKETAIGCSIPPFGTHINGTDTAVEWFRQMYLKGYSFKNMDLTNYATHAYFSKNGNGHSSLFSTDKYKMEELEAKKYLENHFQLFTKPQFTFLQHFSHFIKIKMKP
jgi:hypothetical protein